MAEKRIACGVAGRRQTLLPDGGEQNEQTRRGMALYYGGSGGISSWHASQHGRRATTAWRDGGKAGQTASRAGGAWSEGSKTTCAGRNNILGLRGAAHEPRAVARSSFADGNGRWRTNGKRETFATGGRMPHSTQSVGQTSWDTRQPFARRYLACCLCGKLMGILTDGTMISGLLCLAATSGRT